MDHYSHIIVLENTLFYHGALSSVLFLVGSSDDVDIAVQFILNVLCGKSGKDGNGT